MRHRLTNLVRYPRLQQRVRLGVLIALVGKILNAVTVERGLRDNLQAYAANLKQFAELQPFG